MKGLNPLAKGDMGTLHDSSNGNGETLFTVQAHIEPVTDGLGLGKAGNPFAGTVDASGAFGPADGFKDGSSFVLGKATYVNGRHVA